MNPSIDVVLTALGEVYYQTVPSEHKTYCALTAQTTAYALNALGLSSHLIECQMLYGYPTGNLAIGFTDQERPGKWNGHVICSAEGWLIDAATRHLMAVEPEIPDIVIARMMPSWSSAIAKKSIDTERSILWLHRPPGKWPPMPTEPGLLVKQYGGALAAAVRQRLGD